MTTSLARISLQAIVIDKVIDFFLFMKDNSNLFGGVPERSKGSDCKSDGSAFEGSNPSPSTSPALTLVDEIRMKTVRN